MIYLDNAATTYPKPDEIHSIMSDFYKQNGANVGRGQHSMANTASNMVKETKELLKELLYCKDKEIVFTSSATESLNVILQGLNWSEDFTVYVTPFEHNSVMRILSHLQTIYKIRIEELYVDKTTLLYDLEKIKYQFQDKSPDIVIISHASNVCGLITPIKEICDFAKTYKAITVIDMAQTAGLVPTDLSTIQVDYVVFAGHKTLYGPFGIAGIVLRRDSDLKPLLYGGTGINSASMTLPSTIPEKFEVGSQNIMAIAGLNAALKWIRNIGIKDIRQKERENTNHLIELLKGFDNIKIVGYKDENHNIGVISCLFEGYSSDNIGQILNEHEIAVRTGLHCSPTAHKFFNTFPGGTVRFSIGYYNTNKDFERLKEILDIIELE